MAFQNKGQAAPANTEENGDPTPIFKGSTVRDELTPATEKLFAENPVLAQMSDHRTVRSYSAEPVSEDELHAIVAAVEEGPNWCNFQHVSIVSVDDPVSRQRAYELCGRQEQVLEAPVFLMFCADFYRTWLACDCSEEVFDQVTNVADNIIVGATEVGIALGSATVAAEALGLGTCCVGAAREREPEMRELLHLPRYVFPVCGFCIGHAAEMPDLKPRLPERAVFFRDRYDTELESVLALYDEAYRHYLATRSANRKEGSWSQEVASYYTIPYTRYEDIPEMLRHQGFGFEK